MRILHVIPQFGHGGTERIVAELYRWQRCHGNDSEICVLGAERTADEPFGMRKLPHLGFSGSLRDIGAVIRCVIALRREISRYRPDVIHAHLWPAVIFSALAIDERVGFIVHAHDARSWLASPGLRYDAERTIYRRLMLQGRAHVIAVSAAVARYTARYLPWNSGRIEVIHNGVDVDLFSPAAEPAAQDLLTIGSAGRLEAEKGFELLIEAAASLLRKEIKFRLILAGEGVERRRLEDLIRRRQLTGCVEMPGVVENMRKFYDRLDVFVLPSYSEGLPITLLEAMSMGKAVIATTVGGVPELVRHDVDGLLVAPGDLEALGAACERLATDRMLRGQVGRNARARISFQFNVDIMNEQVKRAYDRLMRRTP